MRISDELNVDIATDGTVYGIELLSANEQLTGADGGRLVVIEPTSDLPAMRRPIQSMASSMSSSQGSTRSSVIQGLDRLGLQAGTDQRMQLVERGHDLDLAAERVGEIELEAG